MNGHKNSCGQSEIFLGNRLIPSRKRVVNKIAGNEFAEMLVLKSVEHFL